MKKIYFLLIGFSIFLSNLLAIELNTFLQLGPLPVINKLFQKENNNNIQEILKTKFINIKNLQPSAGDKIEWFNGQKYNWRQSSNIKLTNTTNNFQILYITTYIQSEEYQDIKITLNDEDLKNKSHLYLNGEKINERTTLRTGKHILVVKIVLPPDYKATNQLKINIEGENISATLDNKLTFWNYKYYGKINKVYSFDLSKDGKYLAVLYSNSTNNNKKNILSIFNAKNMKELAQIDYSNYKKFLFTPNPNKIALFKTKEVVIYNILTKKYSYYKGLNSNIVDLQFSPDGEFIYYTTDEKRNIIDNKNYTIYTDIMQKLTDWTDARVLYKYSFALQTSIALTQKDGYALDEFTLSPSGKFLVFTTREKIVGRPYCITKFYKLDLNSNKLTKFYEEKIPFETRARNFYILANEKEMLYTSAFMPANEKSINRNLTETDIFKLNLISGKKQNLTSAYNITPSESGDMISFNPYDKKIYFLAGIGGKINIFKLNLKNKKIVKLKNTLPLISKYKVYKNKIYYTGQSFDHPTYLYLYNKNQSKLILKPSPDFNEKYKLAKWVRYTFKDRFGYEIEGWLFYPIDFDKNKKYPLIVYYYGGVIPSRESFRFDYQFWTANGYCVYVLNPLGAIGYGNEFANFHANDWGDHATYDIIDGVTNLIKDKPFIDKNKIGCYGGSYGGFTTMDLITKTNIFAAAVELYGISNIASYWGGGTWGFTYGDIALAGSYPWNKPEIFWKKSPLFNADKINTPLLLIHGDSDINVPFLESMQMFTALQVLNKKSILIKFKNEDHGIVNNFNNYITYKTMMLDWFDKYLKGKTKAWDDRIKKSSE